MNTTTMAALLGRSLTTIETTNYELYLKIARESLDDLLCTDMCSQDDPRVYDAREGYSTLFTDIFSEVTEVKVNDEVIDTDKYSVRQWNKRSDNLSWYNSIVFDYKLSKDDEVEVTGTWGFTGQMPKDLQTVLAGLFDLITKKNKFDGSVSSKRVEDFQISFASDVDLDETFYTKYNRTINKYGLCGIGQISHGRVC